ncbi:hypothetical protein OF83DRAFT_1281345 [Amylostereum chailletii]|nr:hypothetical protein OF83DRAFT_1281345 [Amylostereum chailletii]
MRQTSSDKLSTAPPRFPSAHQRSSWEQTVLSGGDSMAAVVPGSLTATLTALPYLSFLSAYPHPAFVLSLTNLTTHGGPSLNPVFANPACRSMLLGPNASTAELDAAFTDSLSTAQQARRFTDWAFMSTNGSTSSTTETLIVDLTISWLPEESPSVQLELTQTLQGDFVVCTSIPRTESPLHGTSPSSTSFSAHPGRPTKIPNFSTRTTRRIQPFPSNLPFELTPLPVITSTRDLFESYDWALTPLGPRETWSDTLRACVSYTLSNPFPISTWWGPDLVLVYNDAYAEIAGSKHPAIFGKAGSKAWAELWEMIGPVSQRVMAGEPIYRKEDLLLFNRLTDANLPEETYHNWNFVPVTMPDGTVGGYLNGTFDNTQKVVTERRLAIIRDISTKAGLARTQAEFTTSLMDVFQSHELDAPFVAIYSASVLEVPSHSGEDSQPRTSYVRGSDNDPPVKVQLTLRGKVGIPDGHPSMPKLHQIFLNAHTLRPSPVHRAARTPSPVNLSPLPMADDIPPGFEHRGSDSEATMTTQDGGTTSSDTLTTLLHSTEPLEITSPFWPFEEAFSARKDMHVEHLPSYVVDGFELRGWKEHAREAVLIPITVDDSDIPGGILVLGLNSRRPYDEDYRGWIDILRVSLCALLTAVQGREADAMRVVQLAQLDDAKTAFFSNASHEFRTPLTLIQGPLQDCLSSVKDPRIVDKLQMASRNVVRLRRLVDSLMDFSKLAANKLEGRFRPLHLGAFTTDLASLFRSVIEKGNIEYVVDCAAADKTIVYVDPDFWEKIVFNLIGNAFKYTLQGTIAVSLHIVDGSMRFDVKDTGVGIPQTDVDKIFERFHRVECVSRSYEGTGIGLALTKELVNLHGGKLTVTSATAEEAEDHGSCFTVTLPLGKDHIRNAHIDPTPLGPPQRWLYGLGVIDEATHWFNSDAGTPSESSESGSSSEGSKFDSSTLFFSKTDVIMLVDDNADMRHASLYMKSLFYPYCQVVEAINGQDALNMIADAKPNLIISDVMMPVLDGFGLIAQLRQRPETRLLPIIIVTAKETEEARVEGLLSGADDYMCKPFTGKELIARVHLQMQLGKRRVELEALFSVRAREIQLLADMSPVGIVRADLAGDLIYVNQRWWEISGADREGPIDSWPDSVKDDDKGRVLSSWNTAVQSQKSASLEFQFKNGRFVQGQFEPLLSESGSRIGVLGTITDVSDQRQLEQSRVAHAEERELTARRQMEEAEVRRQEADEQRRGQELLIDVTSHELRQPVSAILNCSSLVRANIAALYEDLERSHHDKRPFVPSPSLLSSLAEDLEGLDSIYQCGQAQERIANDVLSLSRIQLHILSISPVDFELVPELRRIVSIFRNEVKMKRITLDIKIGDSLSSLGVSCVRTDKARFGQILTNLLSNGIKFTDTSSTRREILVTLEVSRNVPLEDGLCLPLLEVKPRIDPMVSVPVYIYVSVKDSGPGLQPEDLALLFRRFQQGSNSHNVFGGSGLGLFVSRKLCDLMEGRIDVHSVYGEGATFMFYIKATTASQPPSPGRRPALLPSSTKLGSWSGDLHVLIAEDNIINQTILK